MLPDLVSLALFVRVAETRSITKAAEASHTALAAASRRISQLEHQYGVKLLDRTARGAELTPAGRAVLHRARQILSQVDQLRAELSEYATGRKGHVRIQASASAISQFLPADLATFTAASPQLVIALDSFAALCKIIESGLGIGVLPEGAARPFVAAGQLRLVRLSDPWAVRRTYVCCREYKSLPPIARKLVDHLKRARDGSPA
jgi:DNA-binding transcriptional LysR family regulator